MGIPSGAVGFFTTGTPYQLLAAALHLIIPPHAYQLPGYAPRILPRCACLARELFSCASKMGGAPGGHPDAPPMKTCRWIFLGPFTAVN